MIHVELMSATGKIQRPFEVNIVGEVIDVYATFQVVQHFRSSSELSNNSTLRALIPNNSIVCNFGLTVNNGGTKIISKPAPQTQSKINQEIQQGYFLIEYQIDNFPVGSVLYFSYTEYLIASIQNNIISVKFTNEQDFQCSMFRIDVSIEENSGINKIKTTLPNFELERDSNFSQKLVADLKSFSSSFEIEIELYNPFVPLLHSHEDTHSVPLMIDFENSSTQNDFFFLIDQSSSMTRKVVSSIKNALHVAIRSLPLDSRFEIIGFGQTIDELFKKLSPINETSFSQATKYIEALKANQSSSNITDAILKAISLFDINTKLKYLIIFSDGILRDDHSALDALSVVKGHCKVCVLRIGPQQESEFCSALARESLGGVLIQTSSKTLTNDLLSFLRETEKSSLLNPTLSMNGKVVKNASIPCFSSEKLTPIFFTTHIKSKASKCSLKATLGQAKFSSQIEVSQLRTQLALDKFSAFSQMLLSNNMAEYLELASKHGFLTRKLQICDSHGRELAVSVPPIITKQKPKSKKKKQQNEVKTPFQHLVELQKFDGSFANVSSLQAVIKYKISMKSFKLILVDFYSDESDTVLALAILSKFFETYKPIWELLAMKSLRYLSAKHGQASWERIVDETKNILSS